MPREALFWFFFFSLPSPHPISPSGPFSPSEGTMARPGWRCLDAASGQLLSPLLCPSFLPWHGPSHTPDPGFSGPVAATEASQVPPGEELFALLCSTPHPEPSDRGEVGLDGPSRLQPWHCCRAAARGVQLLLFQCLFPPCPADPLKTGSVFRIRGRSTCSTARAGSAPGSWRL